MGLFDTLKSMVMFLFRLDEAMKSFDYAGIMISGLLMDFIEPA